MIQCLLATLGDERIFCNNRFAIRAAIQRQANIDRGFGLVVGLPHDWRSTFMEKLHRQAAYFAASIHQSQQTGVHKLADHGGFDILALAE